MDSIDRTTLHGRGPRQKAAPQAGALARSVRWRKAHRGRGFCACGLMATMQKVGEYFKLTWAVEGIRVIGCRPTQIDFLADRSCDAPIVSAIGVRGTMLENSTSPVRGNAPSKSLPISECFEALISVKLRRPRRESIEHGLTPNARHASVLTRPAHTRTKNRDDAGFHERNCGGAKLRSCRNKSKLHQCHSVRFLVSV